MLGWKLLSFELSPMREKRLWLSEQVRTWMGFLDEVLGLVAVKIQMKLRLLESADGDGFVGCLDRTWGRGE